MNMERVAYVCILYICIGRLVQGICGSTTLARARPLTAIGAHLMGAECWLSGRWGVAVKLLGPLPGQQLLQLNPGRVSCRSKTAKANIYSPLSWKQTGWERRKWKLDYDSCKISLFSLLNIIICCCCCCWFLMLAHLLVKCLLFLFLFFCFGFALI